MGKYGYKPIDPTLRVDNNNFSHERILEHCTAQCCMAKTKFHWIDFDDLYEKVVFELYRKFSYFGYVPPWSYITKSIGGTISNFARDKATEYRLMKDICYDPSSFENITIDENENGIDWIIDVIQKSGLSEEHEKYIIDSVNKIYHGDSKTITTGRVGERYKKSIKLIRQSLIEKIKSDQKQFYHLTDKIEKWKNL